MQPTTLNTYGLMAMKGNNKLRQSGGNSEIIRLSYTQY